VKPFLSRVFVVEDDPSMRNALKNLLKSVGLQPELFASAEQFLDGERPDLPSCLILDVRLPGLDGIDLQKKLRTQNISIPVIIITGHGDTSTSLRAGEAGAVAFLTKPFHDQDLLDAIQLSLARDCARRRTEGKSIDLPTEF